MWQDGLALILCAAALGGYFWLVWRVGRVRVIRFEMYERVEDITLAIDRVGKVNVEGFGQKFSGDFKLETISIRPVTDECLIAGACPCNKPFLVPHTYWEIEAKFVSVEGAKTCLVEG